MADDFEIWERPDPDETYLVAGWRQWADAGSISSGLPQYLIKKTDARQIGEIHPTGFYLFQFPGTHDLVRPIVKFDEGYPEDLQVRRNELYLTKMQDKNLVIFSGDEPHLDIERYVATFLDIVEILGVTRVIGLGGVYGELPYDKARMISAIYSRQSLKDELQDLGVTLSDYQGGASIGSYFCKRAGERGMDYLSFYAFVPTYDFSSIAQLGNMIRIENDYMAWYGVMRRVNHLLKLDFDLSDLERKSERLIKLVDAKVEELESVAPDHGVREYLDRLSESFTEVPFDPLGSIWEEELRRLDDKFEEGDEIADE